jgi:uridylate kinase
MKKDGKHTMDMKRILLKMSGEALAGDKKQGFDEETVKNVTGQVKQVLDAGIQVCIVIGGGNFWRGRTSENMDRVKADSIGMLATVMNCIYTADSLRSFGVKTHIMTPFACGNMTELFDKDKAIEYMEKGEVVFFAGGIGHPYFSTDMATVLMAIEVCADVVLSAKAIDGVYDSDPKTNPDAKKYDTLEMKDIVDQQLGVIDLASAVLAMENKMPMMLFGLGEENSIVNAVTGKFTGTLVKA